MPPPTQQALTVIAHQITELADHIEERHGLVSSDLVKIIDGNEKIAEALVGLSEAVKRIESRSANGGFWSSVLASMLGGFFVAVLVTLALFAAPSLLPNVEITIQAPEKGNGETE